MNAPSVSVVLIAGNQRVRAARALASVLDQEGIDRAEVIVLDAATDGSPPLPRSDEDVVRIVWRPERGTSGALRAEGARLARAPIVAYLEEHAFAFPGWLLAVDAALGSGEHAAASGEVHGLNPGDGISDAIAVMNYARWLPPLRYHGTADLVVGHDAAYRRDDLLQFGAELDDLFSAELVLQWKLRERGRPLLIDPAIRIAHMNETTTRSICKGYYLWHVSFGAGWSQAESWSTWRRALQVLGVPWWVARRLFDIARDAPAAGHRRTLLRHLPTVLASQSAAAWGIAVGCTLGDRGHARRFADYELDEERGPVVGAPSLSSS
jgi:glycosyltransferase involved in cell wall biosynthesis